MPRYVDHEARRRHVASIAADLVARQGVDALTVRRVADAAGYSTAVVSHYFEDKRDLLLSTYQVSADRSTRRYEAVTARGKQRLLESLEALLPLDDERRADWSLWFAFWGFAATDPMLAAAQRDRVRSARGRIEQALDEEAAAGRLREGVDRAMAARTLLVVVHGIGTQTVFDPDDWTPQRQCAVLAHAVAQVVCEARA